MKYFIWIFISILNFTLILPPVVFSQNCESLTESECLSTGGSCVWDAAQGCITPSGGPVSDPGGGPVPDGDGKILELKNPIQSKNFSDLMARIADIAAKIGLPLVVVFMIYAGFLFVSARGDEEKLNKAKTTFFWAVIGALLVIGAFAIATAIENFAKQL